MHKSEKQLALIQREEELQCIMNEKLQQERTEHVEKTEELSKTYEREKVLLQEQLQQQHEEMKQKTLEKIFHRHMLQLQESKHQLKEQHELLLTQTKQNTISETISQQNIIHDQNLIKVQKQHQREMNIILADTVSKHNQLKKDEISSLMQTHASEIAVLESQFQLKQSSSLRTIQTQHTSMNKIQKDLKDVVNVKIELEKNLSSEQQKRQENEVNNELLSERLLEQELHQVQSRAVHQIQSFLKRTTYQRTMIHSIKTIRNKLTTERIEKDQHV